MRILIVICCSLLVFNCEDKQSKQHKNNTAKDSVKIKKESKQDSVISQEKAYTHLNDDNALYFFQEYDKTYKEDKVRITTDFGTIDIQLFPETLYHRSNFIYLTKRHYFDGTQFYRVVPNFVIQGGNSDDVEVGEKRRDIGTYLLPPDTKKGFKHDRGIISMPSSEIDDAYKMASPYQFFIVQNPNGAHHLDGQYTAFGKVINGMDVVDEIAKQPTDESEWPLENIYIRKIEIIK